MQKTITMKDIKDNTDREIYHVLGLKNSILWKWLYYPKQSRFKEIPIKLPMAFFIELEQKIYIICMETEKTSNSQSNLEKEKWS